MSQKRKSKAGLDRHYKFEVLLNALFDIKNSKCLHISNLFYTSIMEWKQTSSSPLEFFYAYWNQEKHFCFFFAWNIEYGATVNQPPTLEDIAAAPFGLTLLSPDTTTLQSRERPSERASGVMDCVGPALAHDIRDTFSVAIYTTASIVYTHTLSLLRKRVFRVLFTYFHVFLPLNERAIPLFGHRFHFLRTRDSERKMAKRGFLAALGCDLRGG